MPPKGLRGRALAKAALALRTALPAEANCGHTASRRAASPRSRRASAYTRSKAEARMAASHGRAAIVTAVAAASAAAFPRM